MCLSACLLILNRKFMSFQSRYKKFKELSIILKLWYTSKYQNNFEKVYYENSLWASSIRGHELEPCLNKFNQVYAFASLQSKRVMEKLRVWLLRVHNTVFSIRAKFRKLKINNPIFFILFKFTNPVWKLYIKSV